MDDKNASLVIPSSKDSASPDIAWRPNSHYLQRNRLRLFMELHNIRSYDELLQRSVNDIEWFWDETVKDLGLEWYEPYTQVLDMSRGVEWSRWFVGAKYNYVHDALDKQAGRLRPRQKAVIWEGEDGAVREIPFSELLIEVNQAANALQALGIGKGDRVGIFMPMIPETVVAVLACGKIGAIYTPIFSGYAAQAVAARLNDCEARLLITADGFYRRGGQIPMMEVAAQAVAQSPSVEHTLVVRRLGSAVPWQEGRDIWWHDFVPAQSDEFDTVQTDAEDPYMIIYTSGTTGKPKGTLHVHCGFPIKAAQDLAHGFDLQPGEVLFWITDLGWMMGPWAICGSLMLGATCMLYEGLLSYPEPDRLWALVEKHRATHLGISPTAIRSLMTLGDDWPQKHDLSSLLFFGSTGEPWNPEPWRWLFEQVGQSKRPIINYSGGTETSGGILSGLPLLPLKPCSFNTPLPGMAADVIDEQGNPVRGEVGELAIRRPWPGMTRGFWQDPDRYIETYWSRLPGVWVHGDWARIDEDGFWYILGRSDDTIKIAGKRLGPAEAEGAAVSHPLVAEALAIGVPDELKGEALVVFVVPRAEAEPNDELRAQVEQSIVAYLGKSLKPKQVIFVKELPRTRNGKILRRLARKAFIGEPLGDSSSLENPAALEAIAALRDT